ncbi:hypothetical protein BC936DRAFT_148694 [Jimgerdemannia flammicorona]|uniref:Protein kinase domain-containing protein n=1 Tax=Jimgerdemannia flammicorona TaxID=994334 RepID=A0A433DNL7_9FUNG|nr:hypothetical protein BC936DRAFT_148694 [Jimgerdemannia flammicorona]
MNVSIVRINNYVYTDCHNTGNAPLPHIPKFYGSYQNGGLGMIVIERMKMDLNGYLEKENVISENKFLDIAVKLIDCIRSFHHYGYVHKD